MKRRDFLTRLAGTGIVLPVTLGFPRLRAFAQSPAGSQFMRVASSNNDHVLVIIRMAGGNDGLNTIIPYANDLYYTARKQGTDDDLSIDAGSVIRLSDSTRMGMHPSLSMLAELYEEQKVSVVQNVGYPSQNQSHFRSTDIWLSGSDADVFESTGWYARYLEERYPDYPDVLPNDPFAIELGTFLSTTLIGAQNNMGVAVADLSYVPGMPDPDPVEPTHAGDEEAYVREIERQSNIFSNAIINAAARQPTNSDGITYPTTPLAQGLAAIARLIAAGLGTQLYIINVGGYDTHTNQLSVQATLHQTFAEAIHAFQRDVEAFGIDSRVAVATVSEFGRRVESNGTGTDHGSAAPLLVIGSGVIGGLIGEEPNLSDLEGQGNIRMTNDFRQVYASILGQWYGATDELIDGVALPRHFEQLPIFRQSPSSVATSDTASRALVLGQNYPNPATTSTSIPVGGIASNATATLGVYTVDGRQVLTRPVMAGASRVEIDTRALPAGTYVYELQSGGARQRRTMVVVR